MKQKGSKFARKHNIINEEPKKKLTPVPQEYMDKGNAARIFGEVKKDSSTDVMNEDPSVLTPKEEKKSSLIL